MSNRHFDVILAGNQLTTLVAGAELARAGRKVCIVNPTPSWGGHFTRLTVNGETFDPGAVSHEFTAFNRSPTPSRHPCASGSRITWQADVLNLPT